MVSTVQTPRLLRFPNFSIKCLSTSQILTTRKSLLSREISAVDLATTFLAHLRHTEPHLKSFLYVSDVVLKEAEEIDRKIRDNNEELGPLAGVLIGVKDNICTFDMQTTAGSRILENYKPAFDATVVGKIKKCGGIVVGKTNMDEFGMGSTTEGSAYQEVPDFASQFIARDNLDSRPLKGLRVGLIRETIEDGVDPEVVSSIRGAASHLEKLGCTVTEVSLPSFSLGLPAYYILASSESSSNLSRYDGVRYGKQVAAAELNSFYGDSRAGGFGSEVKMRVLMGTYGLSAGYYDAYYKRAQQVRTLVRQSFRAALDENDILISPAAPSAAYKIGEKKNDPLSMYAGDIMTVNVNLAGLPALVLPCGFVDNKSAVLPVGIQMIGAAFEEEKLLKVGHIFEQTLQGCSFIPPLVTDELAC
ncbi:glutamyl-tRNA(Gln) amidotransferase subunit A, chloroplastic/mitochondrial-like isoform X2 [Lycium barbarum]|uniref:glutamyl-tRNA(Gln) amidotransferase subunit A, chloroplastic/mitochondrial-like isoform X2 n=1 Tax=Lycium barbarum TaxID=112863 RepID=UPI00293E94AD|nr:glutamyl-tRNA(Gln) amidotransferase subunit A, chloroplastic/mitochondrial-like isoform X2 [Lycium barbarum]